MTALLAILFGLLGGFGAKFAIELVRERRMRRRVTRLENDANTPLYLGVISTEPWDRLIEDRLDRPPPQSLVQLCAAFGTAGPRLLQEAREVYARDAVSWNEIERRILRHFEARGYGGES